MKEVIKERQGLYRQEFEHDNCGIGAVVNIKGKKSMIQLPMHLRIVENLDHRAGKDAEGKTGDGVGILFRSHINFSRKHVKKKESRSARKENTVLASSFSRSTRSNVPRRKKCSRSSWKRRSGVPWLERSPVVPEVLGHKARECMPCIMQAFIKKPDDLEKGLAFDRKAVHCPP